MDNNPQQQNVNMHQKLDLKKSKFIDAEKRERTKLLEFINYKDDMYIRTITEPTSYSPYDATLMSGNTCNDVYITELKVRDVYTYTYPTAIIDSFKLEKLKKLREEWKKKYPQFNFHLLYIAFYFDGTLIFDLEKYDKKEKSWGKKTTVNNNQNIKIQKEYLHYKINQQQKFVY